MRCPLGSVHNSMAAFLYTLYAGVCIAKWGNQSLDGLSFEGVQRILEGDSDASEVEVGFMTCRLVHLVSA